MLKLNKKQFLYNDDGESDDSCFNDLENSAVVILPFPFGGCVSFMGGAEKAPDAIIEASANLESYEPTFEFEPYKMGICTMEAPQIPSDPRQMHECIFEHSRELIKNHQFPVVLGGDHSISSGFCRALIEKHGEIGVIQLDAHADLRDSYKGNRFSHASVMARIREMTPHTLQIGIRSLCKEEAERIKRENLTVIFRKEMIRNPAFVSAQLRFPLNALPKKVFVTLDVDILDPSMITHTGTPEPDGLMYDELVSILNCIFASKEVIGFDVVELCVHESDWSSTFTVAKLIHLMLAMKTASVKNQGRIKGWPTEPIGPILLL